MCCAASIKALAKQFGKWHGISSLINLGTLITGKFAGLVCGGWCALVSVQWLCAEVVCALVLLVASPAPLFFFFFKCCCCKVWWQGVAGGWVWKVGCDRRCRLC
jgi:hypothetical protein